MYAQTMKEAIHAIRLRRAGPLVGCMLSGVSLQMQQRGEALCRLQWGKLEKRALKQPFERQTNSACQV